MSRFVHPVWVVGLFWTAAASFAQPYPADPGLPPGPFATSPRPEAPVPLPNIPVAPPVVATPPTTPTAAPQSLPLNPASINTPPETNAAQFPSIPSVSPPTTLHPDEQPPAVHSYWNDGLFFRLSENSDWVYRLRGMIQYDAAWYTGGEALQRQPGGVGQFEDGVNPRRLRLGWEAVYRDLFDYRLELEFSNASGDRLNPIGTVGPTDAYLTFRSVPWLGGVRVGYQKEWFSLERLESASSLLFLERSALFDFTRPSGASNRSPGISAFRTWANDRLFTGIGVYKNTDNPLGYGVGDGNYAVTGRVAGLPVWLPNLQTYWHVGGAMTHRDPVEDRVRIRVRNLVQNAPGFLLNVIADTGVIDADSQTLFNLESAFASGPLTVSGEFTTNLISGARVGGESLGTLPFHGFYAQASYLLTGEHRGWDPTIGVFKRVVPCRNFDPSTGGWGAWEVGARLSYLDLENRIDAGRLRNVTLGLTWYWTAFAKLQLNYDYLYRDGGPNRDAKGSLHSLGARVALDF